MIKIVDAVDGWVFSESDLLERRRVFVCVKDLIAHVTSVLLEEAESMPVHCLNGVRTCPTCSEAATEGGTP